MSMNVSKELQDFLQCKGIKKLLNDYNFKELYAKMYNELFRYGSAYTIGEFSVLMYKAGIDPLLYLDEVPQCFLMHQKNISTFEIPINAVSIGEYAFYNCSGLTSITIPDSVTSISDYALSDCDRLTGIIYKGMKEQWRAVNKSVYWKYNSAIKIIHCIDGDIQL